MTNINEFIKAKEEEFDEKFVSFQADGTSYGAGLYLNGKVMPEDIKHFLSQSLLEYNEKIKEMIEKIDIFEPEEFDSGGDDEYENRRNAVDGARRQGENKMKMNIITNLTQDTNPKE